MALREVSFSDLQNRGKATIDAWLTEGARPLRVTRRDAEDLVLMTATRADEERTVVDASAAMLRAVATTPDSARIMKTVLVAAFPWSTLLSATEFEQFSSELRAALEVGASLDSPALLVQAVAEWRNTAEVYADPAVARALLTPTDGDAGAVPSPEL